MRNDFRECTNTWSSRRHQIYGVRLYRRYYLQKISSEHFAINEVIKDRNKPKPEWGVIRVADVTPEKTTIIASLSYTSLYNLFGIVMGRSNTIKHNGVSFRVPYGKVVTVEVVGTFPLEILKDGTLIPTPPKLRTWDKVRQKELNDEIKRVRKAVRLRTKFGAFHHLTEDEHRRVRAMAPNGHTWDFKRDAMNILKRVNEEDYDSFLPLIYVAHVCHSQQIYDDTGGTWGYRNATVEECIDRALNSWRRQAQKDNEIVRYE